MRCRLIPFCVCSVCFVCAVGVATPLLLPPLLAHVYSLARGVLLHSVLRCILILDAHSNAEADMRRRSVVFVCLFIFLFAHIVLFDVLLHSAYAE